jgi:hypothetical protein
MPQLFLHLGNVGVAIEGVGRGRRAKRMRPPDLEAQPEGVPPHQLVDPVGGNGIVEPSGSIITEGYSQRIDFK